MKAAIICLAGAVLGVIVAIICAQLALPVVLRSQAAWFRDGKRGSRFSIFNNEERVQAFTISIYRYVFPATFGAVGAIGAYYLFVAAPPD